MLLNVIFVILGVINGPIRNVAGIIDGHDIDIEMRPYHVHIYDGMDCGGAILNRKLVITAAHCVAESGWGKVRVGSNYPHQGELYYMAKRHIHPLYVNHGGNWTEFDVAMAELDEELTFSTKVQPIKLPLPDQAFKDGVTCQVSGYGLTGPNARSNQQLQTVTIKIVDREKCARAFEDFAIVDDSIICGGSGRTDKLTGPCLGDSGGALVCSGVLAGLVSWGGDDKICNLVTKPYAYTNVANLKILAWIEEQMRQSGDDGGTNFDWK